MHVHGEMSQLRIGSSSDMSENTDSEYSDTEQKSSSLSKSISVTGKQHAFFCINIIVITLQGVQTVMVFGTKNKLVLGHYTTFLKKTQLPIFRDLPLRVDVSGS